MIKISELQHIPIFSSASPDTLRRICECASLKLYPRGSILFRERDEVQAFYFLSKGIASLYKMNQAHDNKVIFLCSAGSMINEVMICGNSASISCRALTDLKVIAIPKARFRQLLAEDAGLSEAVMCSMAMKIRKLYRQMKNTTNTFTLEKQIAAKLWKLSRDYGIVRDGGVEIDFDLSISFLAEMVGAKRETVSRQVKALTNRGLIDVHKKRFFIKDRERLKNFIHET